MHHAVYSIYYDTTQYRVRVWRISGFCGYGDSMGIPTGFFSGYGMGMGIKIQSPRQPWHFLETVVCKISEIGVLRLIPGGVGKITRRPFRF